MDGPLSKLKHIFNLPFKQKSEIHDLEGTLHSPDDRTLKTYHKIGPIKGYVNLLKTAIGVGMFHTPSAIHKSGYIPSVIAAPILILLEHYCITMLLRNMSKIARERKNHTIYEDCVYIAVALGPKFSRKFAGTLRLILRLMLATYPIGLSVVSVLYISRTLSYMYPLHMNLITSLKYYTILQFPFIISLNSIRHGLILSLFKYASLSLMFFILFASVIVFLQDHPHAIKYKTIGSFLEIPVIVGTVLLAYQAVAGILGTEEAMRNPDRMRGMYGVFNLAMLTSLPLYVFIGSIGYWKYGHSSESTIIRNLPNNTGSHIIRVLVCTVLMLSFPTQCYQVINAAWYHWMEKKFSHSHYLLLYEHLLRAAVSIIIVVTALSFPSFKVAVEVLSSFYISFLVFFFPALLDYAHYWRSPDEEESTNPHWIMTKDILIMILAIFISLVLTTLIIYESFKVPI